MRNGEVRGSKGIEVKKVKGSEGMERKKSKG